MRSPRLPGRTDRRRGAVLALAAVLLAVLLILAAFMLNVGLIALTADEAQACADATAVSAAGELLSRRSSGLPLTPADRTGLKAYAQSLALKNPVFNVRPSLDPAGDVTFGHFNRDGGFVADDGSSTPNAVRVRVRRASDRNGPLPLFLGSLLGRDTIDVERSAVAGFVEQVSGFRPRAGTTENTTLVPFTIRVDDWTKTLAGNGIDLWSFDPVTQKTGLGGDGLSEYLMYSEGVFTSGNHGLLRFGGNAMPVVKNQVTNGVGRQDLAAYGGELTLGPGGSVAVSGRPGWPDPIYRAARQIIGKPISIPLHSACVGQGGNCVYTIVGFAGARIVEVAKHGAGSYIRIQPATVLDTTATEGPALSFGIVRPVAIVQ